jgi:hypothetical protein
MQHPSRIVNRYLKIIPVGVSQNGTHTNVLKLRVIWTTVFTDFLIALWVVCVAFALVRLGYAWHDRPLQ